jgi:hypothetical protein
MDGLIARRQAGMLPRKPKNTAKTSKEGVEGSSAHAGGRLWMPGEC